jgi:hypothetical protein
MKAAQMKYNKLLHAIPEETYVVILQNTGKSRHAFQTYLPEYILCLSPETRNQ